MKPHGRSSLYRALLILLPLGMVVPGGVWGADRPNIVWLVTEDNSPQWYRLYNPKRGAPMPHVERLAAQGLVFNNAFSCAPVCSSARSTIISGLYGPRVGTQFHRRLVEAKLPEGLKLFPAYLREAGYYTTNNSKTDYNFSRDDFKDIWDESSKKASYRNREGSQPFFHVQNYGFTHEGQLFGSLPEGEELIVDPETVVVSPRHPDTPLMRQKYAEYLTRHSLVDKQLGEFIDQLEADGMLDDTFVFHYGNHGGVLPGSKGYAYNSGLQVAMVVYVPKNWRHLAPAEPGSRLDGFVQFTDLSATVLNLAGLEIPEMIDGKPFLGERVTREELDQRQSAFSYADRFDEKYDMVRTLHQGRFHYIRSYQPFNPDSLYNEYRYKQPAFAQWRELYRQGKLNTEQSRFFEARPPELLFDLEKDPYEVRNLANDPAYADVLKSARTALQAQVKGMPDCGFIPEPVLIAESGGNIYTYAQQNEERIRELITIADLELLPFAEVDEQIEKALLSEDPLKRYWGLIVCSRFGKTASGFFDEAKRMARSDADALVRTRAVEFLGIAGEANPVPLLVEILNTVDDSHTATLILNTVTLLAESDYGYTFNWSGIQSQPWAANPKGNVQRRFEYLSN